MPDIKFGKYQRIFVDNDFCNIGTDKEYFDLHFQIKDLPIDEFGKELQEACDQKGYPIYVNVDTGREIDTIIVEIHNTEYKDNNHINESLIFIDEFVVNKLGVFTEQTINLELQGVSCRDFLLYYDTEKNLGFEAQFDNGEFNGKVTFCDHIGNEQEDWEPVTDKEIFEKVKTKALSDYRFN